ncbi:uncharacterized protein LOC109863730 [Pseudomyrmex gracilis]|uniref:uncharacterized protein LOC109863730 n=1 Tax=Pseudomyrmex gracilis TaxID=219809 RepID=UPI000994BB2F|nr:uncharacterized protein LOC109863730 [Pseudomyrmex gracilis]
MEHEIMERNAQYGQFFIQLVFCWIIGGATHSQILGFIFHSFGMFKLTRHRIQSIEKCIWHVPFSEKYRVICNEITHVTIAHKRAVKFTVDLIASLNTLYCVTTAISVLAMITDLYGIFEALAISRDIKVLMQCIVAGIGLLSILFVAVYIGEKITAYNRDVAMSM